MEHGSYNFLWLGIPAKLLYTYLYTDLSLFIKTLSLQELT